ncbi:MAG: TadE/TadG family type IV pilus assembly protein [Aeromicrobium sp.]
MYANAGTVRPSLRPRRIGGWRRREGQSLVEFAVVLPVFLLILAGIIDFGLGLYSQMTVINAAREGARLGIVELGVAAPGSVDTVKDNVRDRVEAMSGGLDLSQLNVQVDCQAGACVSGNAVVVNVDYQYRMLWPLAFGNTLHLGSTVQMRIE